MSLPPELSPLPRDFDPAPASPPRRTRGWVFAACFLLSCYTMLSAGGSAALTREDQFWGIPGLFVVYRDFGALWTGASYAAWLLAILGCHEMGHYVACRYYRIEATPPLFLPGPQFPFGTLGAFIRIRSPFGDRNALFDVGIAGPLAGFAVTVPALLYGLARSTVVATDAELGITLGDSLLSRLLASWIGPPTPDGTTLLVHPAAYAGWVGLFATAMNLLPIGQLDGGHVTYAISPRLHLWTSRVALVAMLALGVFYLPWAFWGLILALVLGTRHPRLVDESSPLSPGRRLVAIVGLAILILCFIPMPFAELGG